MNDNFVSLIEKNIKNKFNESKLNYQKHIALLDSFSPLKTLSRGYSVVQSDKGEVINKKKSVKVGDSLNIRVLDGNINARVESVI
jgi:exodeoxyribonuclease VII large subunit